MTLAPADAVQALLGRELPWTKYIPHDPEPKQLAFLSLDVLDAMFGGSAGGGKSDSLLMGGLQYVDHSDFAGLILRRTYPDLSLPGAIMDRAKDWLAPTDARGVEGGRTWHFPSGATLTFGYLENEDDKYRYGGAEYQYIAFDELTQFTLSQFRFLFSRLRRAKGSTIPLRMRVASNPGGIGHDWVKARYIVNPTPGRIFIPAKLDDNPHLDREDYVRSLQELDPVTRRQLLDGDWSARGDGGLFKREWFEIVHDVPAPARWLRNWDLAATEEKKGRDPSWTAGALVAFHDGVYYIGDMRRVRAEPGPVENLVKQTAQLDASQHGTAIRMEQEPGSSGKNTISHYARHVLPGFDFRGVPSTGSKVERARPASSAAFAGNIKLVEGPWIPDFLDELEAFPNGSHDDQVDALSGAVRALTRAPKQKSRTVRLLDQPIRRYDPQNNPLGLDLDDPKYQDKDDR